jgi:ABC-type uncharacterized transport system substrate-binding protein
MNTRNFLLWALISTALSAPASAGKVLLVHSYHPGHPWTDGITRGVRKSLEGSGAALEIFYMDTKRRSDSEWKIKAGRLAARRMETFQPDVVIAADDDAQEHFAKSLAGLDRPQLVFCGVNGDPSRYGFPAKNATGILERPYFLETVKVLAAIRPQVRRVAVLTDSSETSDALIRSLKTIDISPASATAFDQAATFEAWKAALAKRQADCDAVVVGLYHSLKGAEPEEAMAWTMEHSRIPVAGLYDFSVQDGALCAFAPSAFEHGFESGEIAKRILAGAKAGDIPVATAQKGGLLLNLKTAKARGVALPAGLLRSADRLVTGLRADAETVLSALVALIDERLLCAGNGLRLVALTREARGGRWEDIGPLLAALGVRGIAWYARPDGSYFTASGGSEKSSLMDRPYFARLLAGREVAGELVVSRSTGRKAAVVAIPILEEGKVLGALGVSIFLDDLVDLVEDKLALPGDVNFFALNREGQAVLHRDKRRIMDYPARLGSESLAAAVNDMLYKGEGAVVYDYNGRRMTMVFKASPLTGWPFALGTGKPASDERHAVEETAREAVLRLGNDIRSTLGNLDNSLSQAARKLAKASWNEPEARKAVSEVCASNPDAVACSAADADGRLAVVEPLEYRVFEGSNISRQEHVSRWQTERKPFLSKVFRAVEGYDAVVLGYPILSESGELLGAVNAMVRPDLLIGNVVAPAVEGLPFSAWAVQEDGRILYDPNEGEIGRMLFSDPLYQPFPGLLGLGRKIVSEESGAGTYEFPISGRAKPVRKKAFWTRVGLHGTPWSLVVTAADEAPDQARLP